MTKHGITGLLSSVGLIETDETTPAPDATHVETSPPIPAPSWPPILPSIQPATVTLTPEDEAQFKSIESQIYSLTPPSTYTIFDRVYQRMNRPADLSQVFDIISASRDDISPTKVSIDIDRHLAAIKAQHDSFEAQIAKAKAERVDSADSQIMELQKRNDAIQAELAKNNAMVVQLQTSKATAEKAINDGRIKFGLIETRLSQPLLQAQQYMKMLVQTPSIKGT